MGVSSRISFLLSLVLSTLLACSPALEGEPQIGVRREALEEGVRIASITTTASSGSYGPGATLPVKVTFTGGVYIAGESAAIVATLSNGRMISGIPASGANDVDFTYVVEAGDGQTV